MIETETGARGLKGDQTELFSMETPRPSEEAAPRADTQQLAQEMNAMEAVRELLFGRRLGEFQGRLKTVEESMAETLYKSELAMRERLGEMDSNLRREMAKIDAAATVETRHREAFANETRVRLTEHETRLSDIKMGLESLSARHEQDILTLRRELGELSKSLSADLAQMRATMPTVEGLAELFRHTAERMRNTLSDAPGESRMGVGADESPRTAVLSA